MFAKSDPYLPRVATATEIIKAISLRYTMLKFFPSENIGGLKALKALSAAFPNISFLPTGGINENNICDYLSFRKVLACGGSWMTGGTPEEIEEIEEKTRRAVYSVAETV